jgi:putative ATP-grasp target RiPP
MSNPTATEPYGLRHRAVILPGLPSAGITTCTNGNQSSVDDTFHNPLSPIGGQFPLGRPYGRVDDARCRASRPDARPFGLRRAIELTETVLDTSTIGYDPVRQIGVTCGHDGAWLPLMKHSTGSTSTKTGDCQGGPDSDTDATED